MNKNIMIMQQAQKIDKEFKVKISKLPKFRDEVLELINKQLEGKTLPTSVVNALDNFKNAKFDKLDGDKGLLSAAAEESDWDASKVDLAWVLRSYK